MQPDCSSVTELGHVPPATVTVETIEPAFRYLRENGYRTVVSDDVARLVRHGRQPGPRTVMLAFDDAWAEISHHFAGEDTATEHARMRLAHAVLIVAREDSNDADRLKNDALQVMALAYKKRNEGKL